MQSLKALLASLALLLCGSAAHAAPGPQIVGYIFPREAPLKAAQIDAHAMTRINYAFATIKDGRMAEGSANDAANLATLTELRHQNPSLKILVSVGGWFGSAGFSAMAATADDRARFIDSAVAFLSRYNLDGLDLDWEYPAQAGAGNPFRPADKQNFTALLAELRTRFDKEERLGARHWLLTIAAGATKEYLDHTEMRKAQQYLDTINLMSYDYAESGVDKLTAHHAPLYPSPADPLKLSADGSVRAFLRAGVPAHKLLLGIPFYGRAWSDVPPRHHGLHQPGRPAPKTPTTYAAIRQELLTHGFVAHWDAQSQVPYLYNAKERIFLSYEDPRSARIKSRYALTHRLGGIMFWSYETDYNGELLKNIDEVLRNRP